MADFIEKLQASGIYGFRKSDLDGILNLSDKALKSLISRQVKAGKAIHLRSGYYAVVPAEYRDSGAPPASWFIDGLMRHLNRSYYVGLLSAAELYGAAHHKPQVFQVVTDTSDRPVIAGRNHIRFYRSSTIAESQTVLRNTPTGYMLVSSVEQTLIDLVLYISECGGSGNTVTVFSELAPEAKPARLRSILKKQNTPVVQRVGLLLEAADQLKLSGIAEVILSNRTSRKVRLVGGSNFKANEYSERWKVKYSGSLEPEA
ncbi:MAG TPA: type IV toxin-antitoxin system AbiEi family antitoxin [Candidatus Sabulitectum sp.]|nr:type IV toxin-antitoxin system AbiEi family antitoxin [Candidatus Sabulitectum sp.]